MSADTTQIIDGAPDMLVLEESTTDPKFMGALVCKTPWGIFKPKDRVKKTHNLNK